MQRQHKVSAIHLNDKTEKKLTYIIDRDLVNLLNSQSCSC